MQRSAPSPVVRDRRGNSQQIRQNSQRINVNTQYSPPQSKKLAFADVFTFVLCCIVNFFIKLASRSIFYDIIISVSFLIKVFLGMAFYNKNSYRSLRMYFSLR